ncbi:hypothetical protein [Microcystis phage Mwe-JY26]
MSRTFRAVPDWAKNEPWTDNPVYLRKHFSYQRGDDRGPIRSVAGSVSIDIVADSVVAKLNTHDDRLSRDFKRDTARIARRTVRHSLRAIVDEAMAEVEAERTEEAAEIAEMEARAEEFESKYTDDMFSEDLEYLSSLDAMADDSFFSDDVFGVWDLLPDYSERETA